MDKTILMLLVVMHFGLLGFFCLLQETEPGGKQTMSKKNSLLIQTRGTEQ